MLGIVLVSHSDLCVGMKHSCEMIAGEQPDLYTVSLNEEGVEEFRERLCKQLDELSARYEQLILVADIPNATPYNECFRWKLSTKSTAVLLSGMNLIMVLELAILHEQAEDAEALGSQAIASAKEGMQKLEIQI